jgi:RNA-directed DNA polymerase
LIVPSDSAGDAYGLLLPFRTRPSVSRELERQRPYARSTRWFSPRRPSARNYYGVPDNSEALLALRYYATEHWYRALRRRSQRSRLTWERMRYLTNRWLPWPRITHPWPDARFDARTQGRSPVR